MAEWIFGIAIEIPGDVVTVDDHPVANQKNGIIEKLLINFDEGGLFGSGSFIIFRHYRLAFGSNQ